MTLPHVFVETNFLFGVFRMPSKRHRDGAHAEGTVRRRRSEVCAVSLLSGSA